MMKVIIFCERQVQNMLKKSIASACLMRLREADRQGFRL